MLYHLMRHDIKMQKNLICIDGMSAGKRDQIDKKNFFEIINVLDQMIKSTSILLRNFFLKKISIWSLFPALTPNGKMNSSIKPKIFSYIHLITIILKQIV